MTDPNFSDSARVPYYHQAHHILPNAVLNTSIDDAAEQAGARLYRLVRIGLLNAMYNLNYKDNMIILPMDRDVSMAIKLPRHLHLNQMKHAAYSKLIKSRVAPVIQDYASLIDDGEEHEEPSEEFDKEQLEAIPPPMRRAIRAWGVQQAPRTVTAMSRKFVLRVTGWT